GTRGRRERHEERAVRGWRVERFSPLGVGRVHGPYRGFTGAGPAGVRAGGARDLLPAGYRFERVLGRAGPALRRVGVPGGGTRAGGRVLYRLHRREEPVRGQRVRVRPDLLVLRGARALPVQGALVGHCRGARAARVLYRHRGGAPGALRLDGLRLRGVLDLHRHQDGPAPGHGGPPGAQPGPAPGPAPRTDDGGLQGRQVLRAPRRQAHGDAALRGDHHGRHDGRRLRRGLHPGDLLHNVERVRRVERQRLRGAGLAAPLLHARGHDEPLRLPEPRALGGPRLRGRQVLLLRPLRREGPDLGLPALHRHGRRRLHRRLSLQDPRRKAGL
ncbi:MAG: Integral membrane protein TerC, partial [uncultured Rubrobacteraceae bacterium]